MTATLARWNGLGDDPTASPRQFAINVQLLSRTEEVLACLERHFVSNEEIATALRWTTLAVSEWRRHRDELPALWGEKATALASLLEEIDLLSDDPLESGLWLLCPHYSIVDPDGPRPGPVEPSYILNCFPELLDRGLAAAQDEFTAHSDQHIRDLDQLGYQLVEPGVMLDRDGEPVVANEIPFFWRTSTPRLALAG
jgi:hypothetical protein